MPIPGQDKDITDNEGNYPNTPNQWLLRNIFGGTQMGWSAGGSSPVSFNLAYPTVPSTSFLIPWVPGPAPGGFQPTNIFIGNGTSGTTETFNGTNGTNGTGGGSADPVSCRFYDGSSTEIIVDPVTQIFFNFPPGEVTDVGGGVVEVTYSTGASSGNLSVTVPIAVTPGGSMSNNQTVSLNYDSTDSFALLGGTSLQLKAITVTPPTDVGLVSGMTVDGFGRVTAYARQAVGVYKITGSTIQAGGGYWEYSAALQKTKATWPFFENDTGTVTCYNFLETANTSTLTYGEPSTVDGSQMDLSDYDDFKVNAVPTGVIVQVFKWGTKYWFTANNPISGDCPAPP